MTLSEIVDQLKACEYQCVAGPLESNIAFVELEKMAAHKHRVTKFERSVNHIAIVRDRLMLCIMNLQSRLLAHDNSKLIEPERSAYEELDEALVGVEFGTDEYRRKIKSHLGSALQHHYDHNSHHPEHYSNGVVGMSLFDLLEMICDLRAVCDEKAKPVIDLDTNKRIHNISDDVYMILQNTINEMGW